MEHARAGGPGAAALALSFAALSFSIGCGPAAETDARALRELEGLAFLPRAELALGSTQVLRVAGPVLIDRFEVTRGEWRRFLAEAGAGTVAPLLAERAAAWESGTETWPASFMTRAEAEAFAAWRGMRLPTAAEWLFAALGPNRWPFPWGTTFRESVANTLELGLGRPAAVGTFESGRTPSGCYDLLGNVYEWVQDAVPTAGRGSGDQRGSALGGSFRAYTGSAGRSIYDESQKGPVPFPLALTLHPASRLDHVGLRCAVAAEEYLWVHASEWGDDPAARSRIAAVGERFGRQALPLLAELAARPGAPVGLQLLAEGARR
jgi:formylglycine-generating enzyme required for sulfatase activity